MAPLIQIKGVVGIVNKEKERLINMFFDNEGIEQMLLLKRCLVLCEKILLEEGADSEIEEIIH